MAIISMLRIIAKKEWLGGGILKQCCEESAFERAGRCSTVEARLEDQTQFTRMKLDTLDSTMAGKSF